MVHTGQFYSSLTKENINYLREKFGSEVEFACDTLDELFPACSTSVFFQYTWKLFVIVDFVKLLHKSDITEADLPAIETYLDRYSQHFNLVYEDLTLIRLDYRFDAKVEDVRVRELLLNLYQKCIYKSNHKKKIMYDNSINFENNSIKIISYDKKEERISNHMKIESFEDNIMRFEVKLLNAHLNSNKHKKHVAKSLSSYFNDELYKQYIRTNLSPFFYTGDYYKISQAETIINNSIIKEKDKVFLREFIIIVSKNGVSYTKRKYSSYKFKKAISTLNSLGINPILIPKNSSKINYITNPLSTILNNLKFE